MTLVEAFGGLQLPPFPPDLTSDVQTVFTAQGQLIAGTAPGAGELLTIGAAGEVLTVGGADPSGLEWAAAQTGTPATTVTGPDAFGASAVIGVSLLYARQDHDHGLPAAPAGTVPATTVTGPDAFGASAVVGTSALYARQDHNHGLPANPSTETGAATTVTGPDAFGASAVVGTSTLFARQDHNHGLPALTLGPVTTAALASSTPLTTGLVAQCSIALAAGKWLLWGQINGNAGSAASYCSFFLGPTSGSASGAYGQMAVPIGLGTSYFGGVAGPVEVTLASPTTVYLNAEVGATAGAPALYGGAAQTFISAMPLAA